jgi:hypothetical protein
VLFFCSVLLTRRCNQLIQVVVRVDLSTLGSREQVTMGGGGLEEEPQQRSVGVWPGPEGRDCSWGLMETPRDGGWRPANGTSRSASTAPEAAE